MYVYVCMSVEVRGQPWLLFLGTVHFFFAETWFLVVSKATNSARLAAQRAPAIHLPLSPQSWDYKSLSSSHSTL